MSDLALHDRLSPELTADVSALVAECTSADGTAPLNEDALLRLTGTGRHAVLTEGSRLLGYGTIADGTGQLTIDPVRRRVGLGARLFRALAQDGPTIRGWWAFGNLPGARGLAAQQGLSPVRELLKLGRSAADLPAPHQLPGQARLRNFDPERDAAGWLAVNARAFAGHPEQGRMTRADLAARMGEDWFDPAGFFLAVSATDPDRILGFHWTKFTGPGQPGEVYVVGVDPDASGAGLGAALLDAGLQYLADRGADDIDLYVEGDNAPALRLYQRAGFSELSRDVMYAATSNEATAGNEGGDRRG